VHPPSIDALRRSIEPDFSRVPAALIVHCAREAAARARAGEIAAEEVESVAREQLRRLMEPTLRRVINATGVILHTNLGRAPLTAFANTEGYCNLEYDLATGKRGKRDVHYAPILEALLGVPAIAVNNNAAATFLVLKALAEGHEVIVSRGELVEIGDGFRIPDIMAESGAKLREVGATNRTHIADYEKAIGAETRMLMRVHPSNFHQTGFVGKPSLEELAALGKERELPVYEDLGSGCLTDLRPFGVTEPLVADSLAAGVDLVSFSCDKLLGGPQAGVIAGRPELVNQIRRHPLYRALRLDKLAVEALSHALRLLLLGAYDQLPSLRMLRWTVEELTGRAERMAARIPGARVIAGASVLGGGSTPDQSVPTALVALSGPANRLERRLRASDPPIVARIENGELVVDLRTVLPADEDEIVRALMA
jgi:L-seryl-tRNA(Ser) seleniumtransferase